MRNCRAMSRWRRPGPEKSTPVGTKPRVQRGASFYSGGFAAFPAPGLLKPVPCPVRPGFPDGWPQHAWPARGKPTQRLGSIGADGLSNGLQPQSGISAEQVCHRAGHAQVVIVELPELGCPLKVHQCGLGRRGVCHGAVGQQASWDCSDQTGLIPPAFQHQRQRRHR